VEVKELYRDVIRGLAWQGGSRLVIQLASWVGTVFVARLLAPVDYGIMAVAMVVVGLLAVVLDMSFAQALIHKQEPTPEQEAGIFYLSLGVGLTLSAVVYVSAPWVAEIYNVPVVSGVLRLLALVLIAAALQPVPLARVMRRLDFRTRSLVEMAASVVGLAVVLVMAWRGYGVWSLAWGLVVTRWLTTLGFLPVMGRIPRLQLHWRELRAMVRYGAHVMGSELGYTFYSRTGVFIIGRYVGEQAAGYYSLAFEIGAVPLDKVGTIFNRVAFPALARVQREGEMSRNLFLQLHRYLMMIALPPLLGLAVVAHDFVLAVLTAKWIAIVPVLQVFCIANILRASGMLMGPVLTGIGRADLFFRYSVASVVVMVAAFLIGVRFGLMGVVYAWLVGYPLVYLLLLYYVLRELQLGIGALLRSLQAPVVATAVMTLAVAAVRRMSAGEEVWARLALEILFGALAYGLTYLVLYREEVQRVRSALVLFKEV